MYIFYRSDIEASGRLYRDQKLGVSIYLPRNYALLLIAARHAANLRYGPATGADIVLFYQLLRVFSYGGPYEETALGKLVLEISL